MQLADVRNVNRTALPLTLCEGEVLPFADSSFDVVVSVYTLHHCRDSEAVAAELLRVTRGPAVVIESVYRSAIGRKTLSLLDRWANRFRPEGGLRAQEVHRRFRTSQEWSVLFEKLGAAVVGRREWLWFPHRSAVFVLTRGPARKR